MKKASVEANTLLCRIESARNGVHVGSSSVNQFLTPTILTAYLDGKRKKVAGRVKGYGIYWAIGGEHDQDSPCDQMMKLKIRYLSRLDPPTEFFGSPYLFKSQQKAPVGGCWHVSGNIYLCVCQHVSLDGTCVACCPWIWISSSTRTP